MSANSNNIHNHSSGIVGDLIEASFYLMLMWVVEVIDQSLFIPLDYFGVHPRSQGLMAVIGIVAHAFLHGDMQHLVGNTIGYIPSAILVITACPGRFRWIFWGIALIAGAGIWLIGTPGSVHVGASGLVFGLIGFALSCAIWMPTFFYGAITGLTIALFIGILPGMLPIVERGVSWEGHAMGFLGGVIMSFIFLKSLAGRKPTPPTFRFIANKKI